QASFLCACLRPELLSPECCLGWDFALSLADFRPDSCTTRCHSERPLPATPGGATNLPEAEGSSTAVQRSGILSAMKHMLNLYLLGVALALLSIFTRLMESLGGLLETPSPGGSWTTRDQLASTVPPRAFQNIHPEGCEKTSLHRL
uniref:Hypoxia inducible lipid droplet associated n=1 Tax=Rhinolophus ferrumequinum TaxID=59479 RepID=A0A671FWH6_RHIFE